MPFYPPIKEKSLTRSTLSFVLLTASFLVSGLILFEGVTGLLKSESAIATSIQGAAYEDVLGLGFWPFFAIFVVTQLILLGTSRVAAYQPKLLLYSVAAALISLAVWAVDFHRLETLLMSAGAS